MASEYQQFAQIYLRLNGYFTINNFIAHKGESWNDKVLNWSESDLLGVRMPYTEEICDGIKMGNDPLLIDQTDRKHDAVIVEVKSGTRATPNPVWRRQDDGSKASAAYILRTFGLLPDERSVVDAAARFSQTFHYENDHFRLRFIIVATDSSKQWAKRGIVYITFDDICDFIIRERASCWLTAGIGVASSHPQWDPLMVKVFEIANKHNLSEKDRKETIKHEIGWQ